MKAPARAEEIPASLSPDPALSDLSITELEALIPAAEARIKELREQERREALAKLDEMATALGLTKADLRRHYGRAAKKKSPRAQARYRNPANPAETWTGNGRRPAWVEDHLSQGGQLEALAISD